MKTIRWNQEGLGIRIIAVCIIMGFVLLLPQLAKMAYPLKYKEYVYTYAAMYGVDPYLVFAMIKAESKFDAEAKSSKNAIGLMQVTENTGVWAAQKLKMEGFETKDLYNPETNIQIGCWYIRWLLDYFHQDIDTMIAAYNGGQGKVNEWLKDKNLSITGTNLEKIPFRETEEYLKKVKKFYHIYKILY